MRQAPVLQQLDRVERGLCDLIADAGTEHRRLDRHNHAELPLNAISSPNAKAKADIAPDNLDFADVYEELWASVGVDIPTSNSHCRIPGCFSWGHAAARQSRHSNDTCAAVANDLMFLPEINGVPLNERSKMERSSLHRSYVHSRERFDVGQRASALPKSDRHLDSVGKVIVSSSRTRSASGSRRRMSSGFGAFGSPHQYGLPIIERSPLTEGAA